MSGTSIVSKCDLAASSIAGVDAGDFHAGANEPPLVRLRIELARPMMHVPRVVGKQADHQAQPWTLDIDGLVAGTLDIFGHADVAGPEAALSLPAGEFNFDR